MVFFIFILLLMFSLSGVLYLMVRALPRMAETGVGAGLDGSGADVAGAAGAGGVAAGFGMAGGGKLLDRWAHSEIPEKIDAAFNEWFLKFLRKFKVFTLKLDNSISNHLRKVNHESAAAEKKIDFKDITEEKEEE